MPQVRDHGRPPVDGVYSTAWILTPGVRRCVAFPNQPSHNAPTISRRGVIDEPDALFVGTCLCADRQAEAWRLEKSIFCKGGRVLALHINQPRWTTLPGWLQCKGAQRYSRGESS